MKLLIMINTENEASGGQVQIEQLLADLMLSFRAVRLECEKYHGDVTLGSKDTNGNMSICLMALSEVEERELRDTSLIVTSLLDFVR